jgi:trehalose-phosphatase
MPDLARPSALDHIEEIGRQLLERPPAVFLDYDGTLVPIAPRPDLAVMLPEQRTLLERLARVCPVAIVTGRGLDDIQRLVDSSILHYAASHGYDIAGPDGLRHQPDPSLSTAIDAATRQLRPHVERVPGAVMESKVFSIAVHHRQVSPGKEKALASAIAEVLADHPMLVESAGKRLFEIRPAMSWHKGSAVSWLLDHFRQTGPSRIPLFIGDDRTDEDALETVASTGVGIFVGPPPAWETAAHYGLADTDEVERFLHHLLELLEA